MEPMEAAINNIQEKIFSFDTGNIPREIAEILARILEGRAIETEDPRQIQNLNEMMNTVFSAITNHDYLLLADVLEYQLKPFLGISL